MGGICLGYRLGISYIFDLSRILPADCIWLCTNLPPSCLPAALWLHFFQYGVARWKEPMEAPWVSIRLTEYT